MHVDTISNARWRDACPRRPGCASERPLLVFCPLPAILLEFPVTVVERADLAGLQPTGDAVEVEGVLRNSSVRLAISEARMWQAYIADTPSHRALLARGRSLVGLAVDAQVHDVVATDGAVVNHDVPGPERHGVPLLLSVSLIVLCHTRGARFEWCRTFLTSNLFFPSISPLAPALLLFTFGAVAAAASVISTSAMVNSFRCC